MTTIDTIIERQLQLYGVISRAVDNLKKLGPAKTNRGSVKSRIEALNANWSKFQVNHESLFKACSPEQRKLPYFSDDIYARCEEEFIDAHGIMLNTLEGLGQPDHPNASYIETSLSSLSTSRSRRLPQIDIPKFSGDYADWSQFRDLFVSIIKDNSDISAVEKLHYLKTSLSGEPAQYIKNIAISGENFDRAWKTLVERYENKRILIDAQLSTLFATRKVKSENSADLKRLLGDVKEALGALESLECPVHHWDLIIVFMSVRKLDPESLTRWEDTLGCRSTPASFADFEAFLTGRVYTLEALERSATRKQAGTTSRYSGARAYNANVTEQKCALCDAGHYLSSCPRYLEKSHDQRREVVASKNLCFNCLGPHFLRACRNAKRCRTCRKQHHTTLHLSVGTPNATPTSRATTPSAGGTTNAYASLLERVPIHSNIVEPSMGTQNSSYVVQSRVIRRAPVLLATALVNVLSKGGKRSQVRALIDQGSEVSFISESVAQQLRLPRRAAAIPILGIGAHQNNVSNGLVTLTVISRMASSASFEIEALVLPKLTAYLPPAQIEYIEWPHLHGLPLADPTFATPGQINLILGANVYAQIIESGLCRGNAGDPIARRTSLGWILSGQLSNQDSDSPQTIDKSVVGMQCSLDAELLGCLQRFWTLEEIVPRAQASLTPAESQCEHQFETTHTRDSLGRFIVRLPLKRDVANLGNSRSAALNSLLRMEKRFQASPALRSAYIGFLNEYRDLNHMCLASSSNQSPPREFYLPHHGILRDTRSTTKFRVVFNGSQKTELGLSLNDALHVGPKLQTDLTDILLRWRRHQYIFAADLEKMYRQIRVHEEDWPLQKVLWRSTPQEKVQDYHLCTVTYGLACVPYLALRCLKQIALESESSRELAADILRNDTYVDDILSGASDVNQAKEQIRQLNAALKAGGFHLRKWISNDSNILSEIPTPDLAPSALLSVDDKAMHHTLGIQWNRQSDGFVFSAPSSPQSLIITKRAVLSFIARMHDPLGWLAPIVVVAKIFMQELWAIRLDWDEDLPDNLQSRWRKFTQQLEAVKTLTISRWFGTSASCLTVELHGFSDASQRALAAVVFVRVINSDGAVRVSLVSAKTKVAPLKRVTIPRLELSAAVLLTRQILKIRDALDYRDVPTYLWTDSTVTLTWIKGHPSRWKDFVRNRVSFIQELSNSRWRHVSGKENPADLASRGTDPQLLKYNKVWWHGPSWLRDQTSSWPASNLLVAPESALEERPTSCAPAVREFDTAPWDLIERYSSLTALLRVTAWLSRARDRWRKLAKPHQDHLTPAELESALLFWVRLTQRAYFSSEIRALEQDRPLSKASSLLRLAPFLDPIGLLRLRGRLQFSHLDPAQRHPLILPRSSRLTTLVISQQHRRTLHGGPQLTLSAIRQRYWIIGGRVPIRQFIHRCMTCARYRAMAGQQIIGQLPASRVTPCRPFYNSGVDYACPLTLRTYQGRGSKHYKGYFIIFVCLSTSAIHLEAATDYSTESFLAAYKRFTGRRGLCSTLTSDCGTNLIGASSELKKLFKAASKEWSHIANVLANDGVLWRFNPPSAPHFGGKWEAGVKSVKHHLRRVVGDAVLTYEELTTLLIQIEAILNSRPLSALSDDPLDISALTPGHFLVGSALTTTPEPSVQELPRNRLSRFQLLRQMTESFWQ